jgi:hypothetical protein
MGSFLGEYSATIVMAVLPLPAKMEVSLLVLMTGLEL